jgi:hypothetical protein
MAFTLEDVVPWGRQLIEYQRMFDLSPQDLKGAILGCADGPASFNAELNMAGGRVISADPLYRFSAPEIGRRVGETFDVVMHQTRTNHEQFVWGGVIADIESLGRVRRDAMDRFLGDYDQGRSEGRYVSCELPLLPFDEGSFNLAVCSHFLFLYSAHVSLEFHIESILELCRVAAEVRIFPLLELGSRPSRHLAGVVAALGRRSVEVTIEQVDYEFQRGGNQMLRVRQGHRRPSDSPTNVPDHRLMA